MERFRFTTTRPVAVLVVFLAVMVFGGFSMGRLPLNLMPDISYPKLTVRTEYPGAAPAEVENNVSRPLEEILGVVTGLTRIESASRPGYSDVILEFTWDTDMDDANQDVLEKIDTIKSALPEEVKQPLILRYDPSLDPVVTLSLSGQGDRHEGISGLKFLRRIGDRDVRRLLEPVEGVAAVKVKGGLEEEIQVEVDEDQLRRTGIGISTVIGRLSAENINLAGGAMRDGRTRYLVRTVNEFASLDDLLGTVILTRDGRDVRLRDIARVTAGFKDRDVITRIDGAEAVEVEVYKEADANIVDMARRVREKVDTSVYPRLKKQYNAGIQVVSDRSTFIESSVNEVRDTAIVGGLLAVIVLFLFLRDLKTTTIVAVSIPISILVTFAPMNLGGVSLNIMSLGGLALGVGMLVDNSIVVLESIHRCREEGDDVVRATIRGTAEVGSAVFASTLTSVAVFFPMVFVEGIAGQMFGDLGLAVVFSLLASLAVALFFIPMLASRRPLSETVGDGVGTVRTALKETWTSWPAVGHLRASFVGGRAKWMLLVVPLVYVGVRFLLELLFDLVGKLVTAGAVLFVGLFLGGIFYGVVRLGSGLARPILFVFERLLGGLEAAYPPVIRWSLTNKPIVYAFALGSFGFLGLGMSRLDSELIPELHQGEFTVEMSLPVGTPLDESDRTVRPLEQQLRETVPNLVKLTTTVGSERDSTESGERGEHTARLRVGLGGEELPPEEPSRWLFDGGDSLAQPRGGGGGRGRHRGWRQSQGGSGAGGPMGGFSNEDLPPPRPRRASLPDPVAAEERALTAVRDVVDTVPDLRVHVTRPVLFSFKTPVEVEVRGYELDDLAQATRRVEERLSGIEGLRDVKRSILPGSPEVQIVYDRDALARQNLDIRQVAELVRDKVQGNEATKFNRRDRKIPVLVRVEGITEATVKELRELVVNPGATRPVPLDAVADLTLGRGPNEIRRIGQQRVGLVTANLEGVALGGVSQRIREELDVVAPELPASVTTAVTGQSQEWETSSRSMYLALALSVFLVYVIMASQFESLLYPLVILVTIPLALVGVVGALWLLNIPVSVVVFLGAIMLAGIVVNNAIVLVDYVNRLKARGLETREALELAGRVRLRPILMTTLTTVLGLLPMALGLGDGAEIRTPMAISVIAGLTFSTVLTLVVIPTLYAGVDRIFHGRRSDPGARLSSEVANIQAEQLVPEAAELDVKPGRTPGEGTDPE